MNYVYWVLLLICIWNFFLMLYFLQLRSRCRQLRGILRDDNEENVEYLNVRLDELREEMKNYRCEINTRYANFHSTYTMSQRVRLDKLLTRLENEINKGNLHKAYKMVKRFRCIKKFSS